MGLGCRSHVFPTLLVSPSLLVGCPSHCAPSLPTSLPPVPQEHGIDYKVPTAIATSVTNIIGVAAKDQAFARMMSKAPTSFPMSSYVLFALRDGLTVTSTFVLKVNC